MVNDKLNPLNSIHRKPRISPSVLKILKILSNYRIFIIKLIRVVDSIVIKAISLRLERNGSKTLTLTPILREKKLVILYKIL